MLYDQPLFRPPSEADSLLLQAAHGCSAHACTGKGEIKRATLVQGLKPEV